MQRNNTTKSSLHIKFAKVFYTLFIFTWMYCSAFSPLLPFQDSFPVLSGHILIISNIVLASLQSFVNDMLLVTTLWLPFCMLSSSDNLSEDFLLSSNSLARYMFDTEIFKKVNALELPYPTYW